MLNFSFFSRLYGRFSHLFHSDKPLFRQHRLHCRMAPVTGPFRDIDFFDFLQEAFLVQLLYPFFTTPISVHSFVLTCRRGHFRIKVHTFQHFQVMSPTHFKIVMICCRCYFNCTCTLFRIRIGVCNYRYNPIYHRNFNVFSY